jgi:protein SCO1/2
MQTRQPFIEHSSVRQRVRRALLLGMASAPFAALSTRSFAQHAGMGTVDPPVRLADAQLVDQTGRKRSLSDLLSRRVTALQTIYTGCSSVCPLQGALFSSVQERMSTVRARHPVQLLSIGIDPLSDSPAALNDWLKRFDAGPAWNAATPSLDDVDRIRTALAGNSLPLGNIANHSTQIYCFDANGMLRWRSADLPRADEVCAVLDALERV